MQTINNCDNTHIFAKFAKLQVLLSSIYVKIYYQHYSFMNGLSFSSIIYCNVKVYIDNCFFFFANVR